MNEIKDQANCDHLYYLERTNEKTKDGFYKDPKDYKKGQMYNTYYCLKCSKIKIIDYDINDDTPVQEFESNNNVIKSDKSYKTLKQEYENRARRR